MCVLWHISLARVGCYVRYVRVCLGMLMVTIGIVHPRSCLLRHTYVDSHAEYQSSSLNLKHKFIVPLASFTLVFFSAEAGVASRKAPRIVWRSIGMF